MIFVETDYSYNLYAFIIFIASYKYWLIQRKMDILELNCKFCTGPWVDSYQCGQCLSVWYMLSVHVSVLLLVITPVQCIKAPIKVLKTNSGLAVTCMNDGSYTLRVNGDVWLRSGPSYFQANGKRYSTGNKSLGLSGMTQTAGEDGVGPWIGISLHFEAGTVPIIASVRAYMNVAAVVFSQVRCLVWYK